MYQEYVEDFDVKFVMDPHLLWKEFSNSVNGECYDVKIIRRSVTYAAFMNLCVRGTNQERVAKVVAFVKGLEAKILAARETERILNLCESASLTVTIPEVQRTITEAAAILSERCKNLEDARENDRKRLDTLEGMPEFFTQDVDIQGESLPEEVKHLRAKCVKLSNALVAAETRAQVAEEKLEDAYA